MKHTPHKLDLPQTEVILDSIADGVFTVDQEWRITSFNRAAEEITGVSRELALGQKCFDVFRADICQTRCALRETLETGRQIVNQQINILSGDGSSLPVSISTAALRDGQEHLIGGVETFRDLSEVEELRRQLRDEYTFADIISKNHEIRRMLDILPDIAGAESTVLIEGPSGCGKELFAKALHKLSPRSEHRFVAVNCGALPDTLLESELFGYVKGAFTDAKRDKPGRFALAENGTLFLDEIGDISPAMQVKLLRVLQEHEYEPLGGSGPVPANVRILAATNKSLAEEVGRGTFRQDLFYRLNVVKLSIPPLAQRREDVPLLTDHFVEQFNRRTSRQIRGLSAAALDLLMQHDFPGNVRELQNIIEHAFVLCRGDEIDLCHLPRELRQTLASQTPPQVASQIAPAQPSLAASPLQTAEKEAILTTLQRCHGHRGRTAAALGMDKTTLWRKMKKFNLTFP
jgi:PAS domain S-box-containing protein